LVISAVIGFEFQKDTLLRSGGESTSAKIEALFPAARVERGALIVVARSDAGMVGRALVPPHLLAGCKVGDAVSARRVGITLVLEPSPCALGEGQRLE
jgi:hypothetical protein